MAYQVLARKYRPQFFSDVAGQDHVTRTLLNALSLGRIAHGYIFSGHRGIGKTTIARILAMALNCRTEIGSPARPTPEPCAVCESCTEIRNGNAVDVIEIDAATNRGIDEIRELRDAARYRPARDRYKIYILDEAHQITDAAFNALLKTLEEPPDHVVFMMATTQPEDIPQTIRSRCQHFSFHAVRFDDIVSELTAIAAKEGITADAPALALLAEAGDGSMRDALSIMDQAIASAPVIDGQAVLEPSQIRELMGTVSNHVYEQILEAVSANQSAEVLNHAARLLDAGNSPAQLARQFVRYLRNCLVAKIAGESTELLQVSPEERQRASRSALLFGEEELTRFLQVMLRTFDELGYRQEQRFHFELGLMKLVHLQRLLPLEQLLSGMPTGSLAAPARTATAPASRPAASLPQSRPAPTSTPTPPSRPAQPAAPAFSPFEADRNRKSSGNLATFDSPTGTAKLPSTTQPAERSNPQYGALALAEEPETEPAAEPIAELIPQPEIKASPVTITAPEIAPEIIPDPAPVALSDSDLDAATLASIVCGALHANGHATAATLLNAGTWTLDGNSLHCSAAASKVMLGLAFNAEAEKISREALRAAIPQPIKLTVVPGGNAAASTAKPRAAVPSAGNSTGAQARALENPLVRRAQEIFNAEIRSVISLREKD